MDWCVVPFGSGTLASGYQDRGQCLHNKQMAESKMWLLAPATRALPLNKMCSISFFWQGDDLTTVDPRAVSEMQGQMQAETNRPKTVTSPGPPHT